MGETILLKATDIRKVFPGVVALDGVRLEIERGEVHALLGENGAGKSTFLKILAGAQPSNGGSMVFDGQTLNPADTPIARQRLGIVTIYQEFNLLPAMTIAENMYLGREPLRSNGLIDWRSMYRDAKRVIDELGLDLDPRMPVRMLSVAEQQMVEISKALTMNARLIIMDEPTAALSGREVDKLHEIINDLRAKGISIIYVTHRLVEVTAVCDRFTVFRDGRYVATRDVKTSTVGDMVRLMVGRDVEFQRRSERCARDQVMIEARGVSRAGNLADPHACVLSDLSVQVRAGEIVGFAGLVGAGRTELARVIFGADGCDTGIILVDGKVVPMRTPGEAIGSGVALVPEDRKQQGCFLVHSIRHNMSLPSLKRLSKWNFFVDEQGERELVADYTRKLGIRMANEEVAIGTLSGGNQQKVLLARCMALAPKVLIVDEPTRGIDVGAKAEVHQVLFEMARAGVAVIVISSELPEVMAVSDRIVTFREGRITGIVAAETATDEGLMSLMALGGPANGPSSGPAGVAIGGHVHATAQARAAI